MFQHSQLHRSALLIVCGLASLGVGSFAEPVRDVAPIPANDDLVELGRQIFNDKSLSEPPGMACVSCHDPATGYSYPISIVNALYGTVPGAVKGRGGDRRPPSAAYAPYLKQGPPYYDQEALAWVGGLFWDGRKANAVDQAKAPFLNPNEMNTHAHGLRPGTVVVKKLKAGKSAELFKKVFGADAFEKPVEVIYDKVAQAIAAFEASPQVSSFTSKYDAYLEGKAELTPQELFGLRLASGTYTGRPNALPFKKSAHCMDCHVLSKDRSVSPDLFTNSCYANLGVPRNNNNLYYFTTDGVSNPSGFNRWGKSYVDLGLGGSFYPSIGLLPGDFDHGDRLRINGAFKAPTLRNVDKRPYPQFVKSYMHNGAFKSLKDVVHFYNTRNLTSVPGEVIDFTKPDPYAGLKGTPVWPRPEFLNPTSLINPTGMGAGVGSRSSAPSQVVDLDAMQIGNLLLTEEQENAIVAFLKTLSDGYFKR